MFEKASRLTILAFLCVNSATAQVIVNEFLASPDGDQEEFIELMNAGEAPVPLADIAFRDERIDWAFVASDSPALLDPGEMLVVTAANQPVWPGVEFLHPDRWPSLNNAGDSLVVRTGAQVTDRVGYGGNERGRSMERIDPVVPGHVAANWAPSRDVSGGTPGRVNSGYSPDVSPPRLLAAEFSPPSSLFLWLSEPIDPQSLDDLRIEVDGVSRGSPDVSLQDGRMVVSLDGVAAPASISATGASDYAGHPMPDTTVSVALPASPAAVELTELLVDAGSGPDDLPEFIELASIVGHPVSLRNARLTIGEGPEPDVVPLSVPDSTRILDPGEILLVYGSPASDVVAEHLRSLLESSLTPAPVRVGIVRASASELALRNAGDLVRLVSRSGRTIDSVAYGPHMSDARFRSHTGRSIRRVRGVPLNAPEWVSTLDERGTSPGIRDPANAIGSSPKPGDLIFSEIMPRPLADPVDGRTDQPEYIEIVNGSNRTISLNGLHLSGPVMDDSRFDADRIGFQPLALEPGGVALFYELPDAVGDSYTEQFESLTDAFPVAYPRGVGFWQQEASLGRGGALTGGSGLLIPLRRSLSLNDDGATLRLLGPDGTVIDSVTYSPSMHHPAVSDPTGRSLERTVLSLTPLTLGDWSTSSVAGGGSPGLLPRRQGPPPSSPDSGPEARLGPKTISPDGDGVHDRTVILVEHLEPGTIVKADIFDIDGRLVRTLVPGTIAAGSFSAEWSGLDAALRPVARGFYIVLIRVVDVRSDSDRVFKLPVAVVR